MNQIGRQRLVNLFPVLGVGGLNEHQPGRQVERFGRQRGQFARPQAGIACGGVEHSTIDGGHATIRLAKPRSFNQPNELIGVDGTAFPPLVGLCTQRLKAA
ncbi:MAG TPA: hypothetical protein VHV55_14615 [Pirellulales bacterium]|nr:hypothetical protein [Pirellulales bacterium]